MKVKPVYQCGPKGKDMGGSQRIVGTPAGRVHAENAVSGCPDLYLRTNGELESIPRVQERLYYSYDVCDGRRETGRTETDHRNTIQVPAGESRSPENVLDTERSERSAGGMITGMKVR